MAMVQIREDESFDSAMRRFKRACEKEGIFTILRRKEYYEKPTEKRKRKGAATKKRQAKITMYKGREQFGRKPRGKTAKPKKFGERKFGER